MTESDSYELATLDELQAAIEHGRARKAVAVDGVPLELLAALLDLRNAAKSAADNLAAGKTGAARRRLLQALEVLGADR